MRATIHDALWWSLLGQGARCEHAGLAYDVLAPVGDDQNGKVLDKLRPAWLSAVADIPVPADYGHAYRAWIDALDASPDVWAVEVALASPALIGHGNPSPTDVGLTLHHTWGVPVIPGSALKGLLNHYVDVVYGPDAAQRATHPMDPSLTDAAKERARYQGVTWEGKRIKHGPGELHRALFGAPAASSDTAAWVKDLPLHTVGETKGAVDFLDAWMVPEGSPTHPLSPDVLTVHQREYYNHQGAGDRWPNDYDAPNPVSFLSVKPTTRFLLAVAGPSDWARCAIDLLRDALIEWGVGGKTTSGYGVVRADVWEVCVSPALREQRRREAEAREATQRQEAAEREALRRRAEEEERVKEERASVIGASSVLVDLDAELKKEGSQRELLDALKAFAAKRLDAASPTERDEAGRRIQKKFKKPNPRIEDELKALLATLLLPR